MRIVLFGLSITSSWGNGHATNYRALVRALAGRGHDVLFLERDMPWYAAQRDLPAPPWGRTQLYSSVGELAAFKPDLRAADLVLVGSYVPEGRAVAAWVTRIARGCTAFWDIDTPVTHAQLTAGGGEYLSPDLVPRFDLYLSFTGGPLLARIEDEFGARCALPFYCMADTETYRPMEAEQQVELGYLGTYSGDRQASLDELLLEPARLLPEARFAVAGPQYPPEIDWPPNVNRIEHLAPAGHPAYYSAQRFTLNVTRRAMVEAGWSPSVRLFEAAACGVPVISDWWEGLDAFFQPGIEILVAHSPEDVVGYLGHVSDTERDRIAARARQRVLAEHTPDRRAQELESHVMSVAA